MPFSDTTRRDLSIEAGGFCAKPDCRAPTGYFLKGQTKSAGDGAHIVAENPNGPRGDSPLSVEERNLASNGVWLCPGCHRKVDLLEPQLYSVNALQLWKEGAPIWWQQNQGKPLEMVARPDLRPQVARPSVASLQGAEMFLKAHHPLAYALYDLRRRLPEMFEQDVPIPYEVELAISHRSTRRMMGRTWQDEWATTYHCEDKELLDYMNAIIRATDALCRPTSEVLNAPRRVNFKQPDSLATLILSYLSTFERFQDCIQRLKKFGL